MPKKIESRARKFLFSRYLYFLRSNFLVTVEALNKDHAVMRLVAEYPGSSIMDWDFVDELDTAHFVGILGRDLDYKSPEEVRDMLVKALH